MQICVLQLLCLALMRTLDMCLCRMQCHILAPEVGLVQMCTKNGPVSLLLLLSQLVNAM